MRQVVKLVLACLLAIPATSAMAQSMFSTIDDSGKIPEIAPAQGERFKTTGAGIVRDGRNLGFFWLLEPSAKSKEPLYVRVTYPNPCGADLTNDAMIEPKLKTV